MDDKQLNIEEIQNHSVKILYSLDEICRQEGIKYFLAYGTLLGAVRHNGFIPWDDDIDVQMPREDYDRFEEYCINHSEELYPLALFSQKTESKYPYVINRLCDTRYTIKRDEYEDCGMGLFVDIYPLDGMGNTIYEAVSIERRVHPLSSMFCQSSKKYIKIGTTRKKWKIIAKYLTFHYAKLKGKHYFGKKIDAISKEHNYEDSEYVGCVVWRTYGKRDIYKKEWMDELIEHKFEDKMLMIPKQYDSILSQIYGDYMTMPPVEKRTPHHYYKAYKR
jgi:lipopolysaccharide cholinephosphotransferase